VIERVCVVGGGTIGSLLAAHLARVVEVWVLTRRREHAAALADGGLRVTGRADFAVRLSATAEPGELPDCDLGILACKGTDLDETVARLEGRFRCATLMTIQNGMGAEEIVRRHGHWPLISAITFMSGTRRSDTEVEYVLDTATWLGPYEETPYELVEEVTRLIVAGGLKAEAFRDLRPAQWSKLVFNATVNSVAALSGLRHDFHFAAEDRPEDLGHLVRGLMDEGKAVAAAAGVELRDDPWEMNVHATRRGSAHYPSMLEDVDSRRQTEIELITGTLVREADRRGVPVPLHWALYRLIKAKEDSYLRGTR
jgi:2-dehydropantoate 2-reductase